MEYSSVVTWLLEKEEPSIRYLTLTELLKKSASDSEVKSTKEQISTRGWAAEILAKRNKEGWWASKDSLYQPKYISTNWMLLILSDLGLTRKDPRIARSCELWIKRFAKPDGGFGSEKWKSSHLCTTGNAARALVKFGYEDHPKVRKCFQWFVKTQANLGGWSCFGSGRNLDSWEPLSAFAVYPKQKWTRSMNSAVERGAEFFLERELYKQGDHYEPWNRFHYPTHYYYDLLVGLDFITALGFASDKRLAHAISLLKKKRTSDGKWNLDAIHPDVEGGLADWLAKHPKDAPIPFSLEKVGEPSKMITLKALIILQRLNASIL
jgi:hypothetical protein